MRHYEILLAAFCFELAIKTKSFDLIEADGHNISHVAGCASLTIKSWTRHKLFYYHAAVLMIITHGREPIR
jgi:hypothetical protein